MLICKQNAFADEFDYLSQIKKYIKCESVLNVSANVLSESEEDFYQHEFHHASIDSRIVALELARVGGYSAEQVDELFYVYLSEYRDALQESEENNELETFMEKLRPVIGECERLIAMQSDIIARWKKEFKNQDKQQIN